MARALYKTTVVIWTDYHPGQMELDNLAREAQQGDAFCSKMHIEKISDPAKDSDWEQTDFFEDWLTRINECTCDAGGSAGCPLHDMAVDAR